MGDLISVASLFNYLPELPEALQKAVSEVVRKAAFDIQANAMNAHPFQNQTGFAEASIYVVTHDSSTYGQGVDQIPSGATLLPEVDKPASPTVAYVAWGASYGVYLELGTRNMPAFPTLAPAAELVRPAYLAALEAIEGSIEL